jgi:hypothetical protein
VFLCVTETMRGVRLIDFGGFPGIGDSARVSVQTDATDPRDQTSWATWGPGGPDEAVVRVMDPSPSDAEMYAVFASDAAAATQRIVVTVESPTTPEPIGLVFSPTGLPEAMAQLPCMNPGSG